MRYSCSFNENVGEALGSSFITSAASVELDRVVLIVQLEQIQLLLLNVNFIKIQSLLQDLFDLWVIIKFLG